MPHKRTIGQLKYLPTAPDGLHFGRGTVSLLEMELLYIQHVMMLCQQNKTHAARTLGIDRRSLYRRLDTIKKLRIPPEELNSPSETQTSTAVADDLGLFP